jgi:hypothetical protein
MEQDFAQRSRRLKIVRQFTNGLATMSEEEAQNLGQTEIVNHLTTFKFLYQRKKRLEQTFTTTRTFTEVKVDTDNPEWDSLTSIRMTSAYNKNCIYHRGGAYRSFIKGLAGEIQIAGGAPVMRHKRGSWIPKLALNMLFPRGCGLTSADIPYAMGPEEMTLADLENLLAVIKGDGVSTSRKAVEALITALKKKPKGETSTTGGSNIDLNQTEKVGSVVEGEKGADRNATVDVWWYYEVKTKSDGTQHVSGTLFNQQIGSTGDKKDEVVGPQVIAYFEKLYNSPEEWLHLICMDMEIGGDTTLDSVRGIAEIIYPSSSEIEVLINLMLSGDKERAKPKWQASSKAINDEVLAWDSPNDSIVPEGVTSVDMKGSSANLMTPMQLLMGNVASLGNGEISNTRQGGELRQQAVGRQNDNAAMQYGDMADWSVQLEDIETASVEKVFVGEARKGCRGYHQMMCVRACMERYNIPLKKLFLKEHGQLKYITVKVHRIIGDGGTNSESAAADFLMEIRPILAPQNRSKVLQRVIAIRTQDPDLAEDLAKVPQPVINAQKYRAENECDTILRRALLGMPLTTNEDDVDQDHIPVHMLDMLAMLSLHQLQPWGKLQVIQFAGMQRHTQDHFENILSDVAVRDEALAMLPQFQQIVQAAQKIVADVEEREGQAVNEQELTPMERETIKLKTLELNMKAQKLGLEMENFQALERQRLARGQQTGRQNYVRELGEATRLGMERRREEREQAKAQAQIAKLNAETQLALNPPAKSNES